MTNHAPAAITFTTNAMAAAEIVEALAAVADGAALTEDQQGLLDAVRREFAGLVAEAGGTSTDHAVAVEVCAKAATGLNLRDEMDRVVFRLRLVEATRITKVSTIADWARALGESPKGRTRAAAVRALARGWGG